MAAAKQALTPAAVRQEARRRQRGSSQAIDVLERAIIPERERAVEDAQTALAAALDRDAFDQALTRQQERRAAAAKAAENGTCQQFRLYRNA